MYKNNGVDVLDCLYNEEERKWRNQVYEHIY